jgi:hypothetical protein
MVRTSTRHERRHVGAVSEMKVAHAQAGHSEIRLVQPLRLRVLRTPRESGQIGAAVEVENAS